VHGAGGCPSGGPFPQPPARAPVSNPSNRSYFSDGPHRVQIRWAKPTGNKNKNEFGEVFDVTTEELPAKYNKQSKLTAQIKAEANKIDFDLEK
jgi:hypothetical protein